MLTLPQLFSYISQPRATFTAAAASTATGLDDLEGLQLWAPRLACHLLFLANYCCCGGGCCCFHCFRSDDLEGLQLWAPKLDHLELRACYSLECVRLMEDPPGSPLTPLRVRAQLEIHLLPC
jgi:hypothetical protein